MSNFLKPIRVFNSDGDVAPVRVAIASQMVATTNVPRRARIARIRVGEAVNYLLTQKDSTVVPSANAGFPLAEGVHDIKVGADSVLKLFNTHASNDTDAYIEYFGGEVTPTTPRVKGDAYVTTLNNGNVVHLTDPDNNFRGATYLKLRASQAIHIGFRRTFNESVALAADTLVSEVVPADVTTVRIQAGTAIHYTTDDSNPSNTAGTDLAANTAVTLTVSPGQILKFYETGGATTVSLIYGNRDLIPSANHGIYIPANTVVNVPCYEGNVYARRVGSSNTNLAVQAFEDWETGGDVYGEEVFRPLTEAETNSEAILGANTITIAVPKRAVFAWISANTQGIRYTTVGSNPTNLQRGFPLAANKTAKIPIVGGTDFLRVLRSAANARVTVCFFALG